MLCHIIYCLSFQMTYILWSFIPGSEKGRMPPTPIPPPEICNFYSIFFWGGGGLIQISERYVHVYHL